MFNKIQNFSIIIFLIIGFILGLGFSVFAWTNPSQNPPLGGGMIQTDTSGLKIVTTTRITSGNLIVNNGNVGIGTTVPTQKLTLASGNILADRGNIYFNTETPPDPPRATVSASAGNLNGWYNYAVTFVTATGETLISGNSNSVNPVNQQVILTNIPTGSSNVIARKIYRTTAGGRLLRLVATINDNTTTTYIDNTPDSSLGAYAPAYNTTGGAFYLNNELSLYLGDPNEGSNVLLGYQAGKNSYDSWNGARFNTFIGTQAGLNNTTGNYNTALGTFALYRNTTGYYNTAVGMEALYSNTTGHSNTAVGPEALYSNTSGYRNSAIGARALYYNTEGTNNSAMGYYALFSNTTGEFNTALGTYALVSNTTGNNNTAVGMWALRSNTSGDDNVAVGLDALGSNTTGYSNTAVGYAALRENSTGYYNTALGMNAGRYIANGTTRNRISNTSVYLGANTKALADGDQNEIVIGYNATGAGSNSVVLGNDSIQKTILKGNVGIGTTAPGYKLDVAGNIRTTGCLVYNGGTLGTCVSDINLKNIIGPFKVENALDKITRFNPVRYTFKKDSSGQVLVGLVAQEVEQFAPEFVTETEDGKQIKYGELQWLQIEAIKELKKENEELRSRIIHLEQEIQELKNK